MKEPQNLKPNTPALQVSQNENQTSSGRTDQPLNPQTAPAASVGNPNGSSIGSGQTSRSQHQLLGGSGTERQVRTSAAPNGDHQPHRHRPRVPPKVNPNHILDAFLRGKPKEVWEEAQKISEAYRVLEKEAAELRFRVNFGTEICRNCEGLRAGPDVVATCFQLQECRYTNVRTQHQDQTRVLAHLTETS